MNDKQIKDSVVSSKLSEKGHTMNASYKNISTRMSEKGLDLNDGEKRVLHNLEGFAKPGEMLAIMGASGCGKTSFLNVLGQRLGLSPGSTMTGEVRCNDRLLKSNDFGKFGAFV